MLPPRPLEALAWANRALSAATATAAAVAAVAARAAAVGSNGGEVRDAVASVAAVLASPVLAVASPYVSPAHSYATSSSLCSSGHGSNDHGSNGSSHSKYQYPGHGGWGTDAAALPAGEGQRWGSREVARLCVEASLLCRDCDAALAAACHANPPLLMSHARAGASPPLLPPPRGPWVSLRRKRAFFLYLAARALADAGSFRDAAAVGALAAAAYQDQGAPGESAVAAGAAAGASAAGASGAESPRSRRPPPPGRDRGAGWWALQVALRDGVALLADCARAAADAQQQAPAQTAAAWAGGFRVAGAPALRLAVAERVASLELDFPLLEPFDDDDDKHKAGTAAAAGTALDRGGGPYRPSLRPHGSASSANGSNGSLVSAGSASPRVALAGLDLDASAGDTSAGLTRSSSGGSHGALATAVEAATVADVRLLAAGWAEEPGALSRVARVRVPPSAAVGDTIEVMRD